MSDVFSTDFAGRQVSLKVNYVAGQADGAVFVTYGDSVVLVTAVSLKQSRPGVDFLPLTVDHQEMTFAAGKIPGGFFKREGRPNEREILTSRIIDRSLRPLFPKGYCFETQIIATLLSVDTENDPDVTAMLGASAALEISDIPFGGPIAGIRVGRVEGQFVCNPSLEMQAKSDLNLFLVGRKVLPRAGSEDFDVDLVMLEGDAHEVEEDNMVDAIKFGLESMRPVMELQDRMRREIGKEKRVFVPAPVDESLLVKVSEAALEGLKEAYSIPGKLERYKKIDAVREEVKKEICSEDATLSSTVGNILEELERQILREMILRDKRRIDGRSNVDIRPISSCLLYTSPSPRDRG